MQNELLVTARHPKDDGRLYFQSVHISGGWVGVPGPGLRSGGGGVPVSDFRGGGSVPVSDFGGGIRSQIFGGGGLPGLRFSGGGTWSQILGGDYLVSDFWGGGGGLLSFRFLGGDPRSQIFFGGGLPSLRFSAEGVPSLSKGKNF